MLLSKNEMLDAGDYQKNKTKQNKNKKQKQKQNKIKQKQKTKKNPMCGNGDDIIKMVDKICKNRNYLQVRMLLLLF